MPHKEGKKMGLRCNSVLKGEPEGFIQWHEWVEDMHKKGWRQKQCKKCQLFHIWILPAKKNYKKVEPLIEHK